MTLSMAYSKPTIPTETDAKISEASSRILAHHLHFQQPTQSIKLVEEDGSEQTVEIPIKALHLLVDILSQMAQGNAVTLMPIHAELTTQEAADILNVSRPFLIKLISSGELPYRYVGRHRRIRFEDLMNYKESIDQQRMQTLDELAAQAQELNMGYD
ncbi:MAG: helix-turn-helix domain-containing protein [Symploca sp. SIO1B1]|nr:helix-turn-helix domain-containing protein [Symploca sp. SIO1B1]